MDVCIFGENYLCLELGEFVNELLAREPHRFGEESVCEDVFPCRFCKVSGRLVDALLQCELLDDVTVFERDGRMQTEVKELGHVVLEAVERLHSLEEQDATSKRPDVCCTHDTWSAADDLWCGVRCSAPDARVLVVKVAEFHVHFVLLPGEEHVGGAKVSVFHFVDVQVVHALRDARCNVQLGVKRVGLSRRHVLLQRGVHGFHVDIPALNVEDAHHIRML